MKYLLQLILLLLPLGMIAQEHIEQFNLGVKAQNNGYNDKALEYYNKCLELNPKFVNAYHNMSIIYYYRKEYNKTVEICNKALETDPNHTVMYQTRGLCYQELKQYDKAIADFTKEIELSKDTKEKAQAYYNRAWSYDKLMNTKAKLADFSKAAELVPDNADYQYHCGRAKFDVGGDTYKTAVQNFTKVIELKPNNKDGYTERATYYMTFQEFKKALKDLKKAKELGGDVDHLIEACDFELEMQEGN